MLGAKIHLIYNIKTALEGKCEDINNFFDKFV